jgi:hypothetical protein
MNYQELQILLSGIDFSVFDAWWKSANPSITHQPSQAQANPVYMDDYHVSIAGWKINVKSRVFESANTTEVINGWSLIDRNLKILGSSIFELFIPFFRSMLIDYNSLMPYFGKSSIPSIPTSIVSNIGIISTRITLGVISLLQLAYWYSKCSVSATFNLKEIELREKLTGFIEAFNKSSDDLTSKLEKIRNDVDDCVSELMFSGLAKDSGRSLSFDGHDFLIDNIPCEVKTIHDEIIVTKNEDRQTVIGSKKEKFGELSLRTEMMEQAMRKKYKDDIRKAIEQGGKIIFISAAFSTVAHDVAKIDYDNNIDGNKKFNQLLQNAIQSVQAKSSNSLPVIVSVGSLAIQPQSSMWYQTYYSFYVPIVTAKDGKVTLDESRYTDYNIINYIDVNDVKFKKYPLEESME